MGQSQKRGRAPSSETLTLGQRPQPWWFSLSQNHAVGRCWQSQGTAVPPGSGSWSLGWCRATATSSTGGMEGTAPYQWGCRQNSTQSLWQSKA